MTYDANDPFNTQKRPSVSFRDARIGTTVTGKVVEAPKMVQARDFDTEEPAYWDDEKTQPKMAAVIGLEIDGEEKTLWAVKPSAMFNALTKARNEAGASFEVGGTLSVKFVEEKKNPAKPKLNPQKIYAAKYEPPKTDAFANDEPPF